MGWVYTPAIWIYTLAIAFAAPFHSKARLRHRGSRVRPERKDALSERPIWFHCASLGEFEQGRPLMEQCRKDHPEVPILLSFFSPSGYAERKDFGGADRVVYLPPDLPGAASAFLAFWNPRAAIFVKYEVWHNFFRAMSRRGIPLFMVSAIFRPGQVYFRPWGGWFRESLKKVHTIFTQDAESVELLAGAGMDGAVLAGDTRFDRVVAIADSAAPLPLVESFLAGRTAVVAGSTWPEDLSLISGYRAKHPGEGPVWIVAPHEMEPGFKRRLESTLGCTPAYYSEVGENTPSGDVLVIDSMGLLSALYRYGAVNYVGGGFGAGIHNTLEPAVYGKPVLFGPRYGKFREARDLIARGGARSVQDLEGFERILGEWLKDHSSRETAGKAAGDYVRSNVGATEKIMERLRKFL